MRMVFKVLLSPVWLILCLLKWTSLIATGIASVVLRLGGILLLLIDTNTKAFDLMDALVKQMAKAEPAEMDEPDRNGHRVCGSKAGRDAAGALLYVDFPHI